MWIRNAANVQDCACQTALTAADAAAFLLAVKMSATVQRWNWKARRPFQLCCRASRYGGNSLRHYRGKSAVSALFLAFPLPHSSLFPVTFDESFILQQQQLGCKKSKVIMAVEVRSWRLEIYELHLGFHK